MKVNVGSVHCLLWCRSYTAVGMAALTSSTGVVSKAGIATRSGVSGVCALKAASTGRVAPSFLSAAASSGSLPRYNVGGVRRISAKTNG